MEYLAIAIFEDSELIITSLTVELKDPYNNKEVTEVTKENLKNIDKEDVSRILVVRSGRPFYIDEEDKDFELDTVEVDPPMVINDFYVDED